MKALRDELREVREQLADEWPILAIGAAIGLFCCVVVPVICYNLYG